MSATGLTAFATRAGAFAPLPRALSTAEVAFFAAGFVFGLSCEVVFDLGAVACIRASYGSDSAIPGGRSVPISAASSETLSLAAINFSNSSASARVARAQLSSAASIRRSVSSRPSSATLSKMPGEIVVPHNATRSGW